MKIAAWGKYTLALLLSAMLAAPTLASTSADEALLERIKPVGTVCVEGDESCAGAVAAAPVSNAAARSPEDIFNASCTTCHTSGVAGAPRIGNKDDWAPHIAKGIETLYKHSETGFNAMPPKGMCMDCSATELHATVDYILSKSK